MHNNNLVIMTAKYRQNVQPLQVGFPMLDFPSRQDRAPKRCGFHYYAAPHWCVLLFINTVRPVHAVSCDVTQEYMILFSSVTSTYINCYPQNFDCK